MRCTHNESRRTCERDPLSVPAITPRCPDNKWKLRAYDTKFVVCQNVIRATPVRLWTRFFPTYLYHLQVYCIEFKVHSAKCVLFQNNAVLLLLPPLPVQKCIPARVICCVPKHDYYCPAVATLIETVIFIVGKSVSYTHGIAKSAPGHS